MHNLVFSHHLILDLQEMELLANAMQMWIQLWSEDVDLEKLRRSRNTGSVRQLRDRRRDLYRIEFKNL